MSVFGTVSKMKVKSTKPVEYSLILGEEEIPLNQYIGKTLSLKFEGKIICSACQTKIKKSYSEGYCFPCSQRLARSDLCIVKPERCHFHLGTCREPEWGQTHCMIPHCVYLANASGLKVGITRLSQIPTRWIDQGAIEAMPIIEVSTRRISGIVEVAISKMVADKTNWRKMLKGEVTSINLEEERQQVLKVLEPELTKLKEEWGADAIRILPAPKTVFLEYPVMDYPKQITSLSWDKTPLIEGTLMGVKGQYLIFDKGVVNVRKHSGYVLTLAD